MSSVIMATNEVPASPETGNRAMVLRLEGPESPESPLLTAKLLKTPAKPYSNLLHEEGDSENDICIIETPSKMSLKKKDPRAKMSVSSQDSSFLARSGSAKKSMNQASWYVRNGLGSVTPKKKDKYILVVSDSDEEDAGKGKYAENNNVSKLGQFSPDNLKVSQSLDVESNSSEKLNAGVFSDTASRASASPHPVSRKARKSLPNGKTARKTMETSKRPVNIANMTLQLREIEKTLGIKALSDVDDKTLDKLILRRARTPKKDALSSTESESNDVMNSPRDTPSPKNVRMVSILKKDTMLAIKRQRPVEKDNESLASQPPVEAVKDIETEQKEPQVEAREEDKKEEESVSQNGEGEDEQEKSSELAESTKGGFNAAKRKQLALARKKRRRKNGNYDLPGRKKWKKKTPYVPKAKIIVQAPKPSQTSAGDSSLDTSILDKSYETVEETTDVETSFQIDNKSPVSVSASSQDPIPGKSTPASKEAPKSKTSKPGESKPVLGSVNITPIKNANSKRAPSPSKTNLKQLTSPVKSPSDVRINPHTQKPYVRGPYKKNRASLGETSEAGEINGKESSNTASKPSGDDDKDAEASNQEKKVDKDGDADTEMNGVDSPNLSKKRKKWTSDVVTKYKKRKLQSKPTTGFKLSVQSLFQKKLNHNAMKLKSKGIDQKSNPRQQTVLDMFNKLRQEKDTVEPLQTEDNNIMPEKSAGDGLAVENDEEIPDDTEREDPAIVDIPCFNKARKPVTLAEVKAALDAEDAQRKRRSKRKRKNDGGSVSASTNDRSIVDDEIHFNFPCEAKRRKMTETENKCPPPSASPSKSPSQTAVPTEMNTARSESAAVATSSRRTGLLKFQNTPNGVLYPVTPPRTPEDGQSLTAIQDRPAPGISPLVRKSRDYVPLCCCKVNGAAVTHNFGNTLYCQALDSIDGRVVGCCNKVSSSQLIRPSVKIPFMAICEVHKRRLKLHQCCPGCGHFCSQGTFFQCKKDGSTAIHHFHPQCQVFRDNKYYCPHCGEESEQYEVNLKLQEPRSLSFFLKTAPVPAGPKPQRARMGTSTRPSKSTEEVSASDTEMAGVTMTTTKGKEISTAGLKLGPSRKQLESAIALLSGEKPKKFRSGNKSLFYGVKTGDLERVVFMLAEGCDPSVKFEDQSNQSAIHAAAYSGDLAITHLLVQSGADIHAIDNDLRTALMVAAERSHLELIHYLVKAGAVAEAKAQDGMTALHLAAQAGSTEVCRYLLQETKKLDINLKDDGGWTPLIWAAEHKNKDCVKFLLAAGANPTMQDNEENTALHWAAYSGSLDIAELFLNSGCDVDGPNENGDRPLHIAARQDHYEAIVLLLARGANVEAKNNTNEAPIECCADSEGPVFMALNVNKQLKRHCSVKPLRKEKLLHRDISMGKEANPIPVVNDVDDGENYPQDFHYVADNCETSPMMVNKTISSLQSCKCVDDCSSLFCTCGRNSIRCWYNEEGRLTEEFNLAEPPLIFECNKACKCWSSCRNRVVQLGITSRLQVFRTAGRGWGLRTLLDIKPGSFVCEYVGEHISDAEADSREDDSYLFDLDNKDTDTFCIDARHYANVARFINHLCEPNVVPVKVFIDHQDLRFPKICFFASREIKAGQELGFDYGEKFWIIKWKQFTCACKSPKCKYSSETIHRTIEDYNRRQMEEEADFDSA